MPRFEPIAVVGAGAIFPGSVDVRGFWQNILAKKDNFTDVPASHWLVDDYYDGDPKAPDKTYARRGAFLPDVPFDAMGFGVPPSILPATDSSQLLALIVAQQVLDDVSGFQTEKLDTSRISVILGVTGAQELLGSLVSRLQEPIWKRAMRQAGLPEDKVKEACEKIAAHYVPWQEASFPGLLGNVVAGRIANRLNLGGTNCIVDAACASALAGVHLAINELQLGQSDLVVTGGVDTMNDIFMYMCFSKTPALSASGDCRPFDEKADGTMLGEGIGMVALKRLSDAERDNDRVYGIIRGLGTSSDGRSKSVYAPVSEGQARALRAAYVQAGYGPDTVELMEAHGTATKAGDAAEFAGMRAVFDESGREDRQWCALGSIKAQIGHTKAAAGIAGLMKVVLALHHKVLPPTIKVTRPNPSMELEKTPFYLNTEPRPWVRGPGHPRRASVSSFGFGGSNFHVTCEEYLGSARRPARLDAWPAELVIFTGSSAEAVAKAAEAAKGRPLAQVAKETQLAYDRAAPFRLAVVAESDADLDRAAAIARAGKPFAMAGTAFLPETEAGKVAFLFPGQGSQYVNMGAELAMTLGPFREALDAAEAVMPGLARLLYPPPRFDDDARKADEAALTRTDVAQPALGAVNAGLLAVLRACGLVPDAAAGHSFGEITALYCAGALDEPTLLRAAQKRGELMAEAAAGTHGGMVAVTAPADAVAPLLGPDVVLANLNAPDQTVIAGETEAVEAAKARLEAAGLRCTKLNVATAFHSPVVASAAEAFSAWLATETFGTPAFPVWSNETAAPHDDARDLAAALGHHLAGAVRFSDIIEGMWAEGFRTFVEIGPGTVLTGLVGRILGDRAHQAVATNGRGKDARLGLLGALGRFAALGLPVDFAPLWADRDPSPQSRPAPKMAVPVNGANYGKPYPSPAAKPVPPNPPQTALPKEEPVKNGTPTLSPAPAHSPAPVAVAAPAPVAVAAPVAQPVAAPQAPNPWLYAFLEGQRQALEAHEAFSRGMTDAHTAFLRTQEEATRALVALATGQVLAPQAPVYAPQAPQHAAPAYAPPVYAAPVYAPPAPVYAAPPAPVYAPPAPAITSASVGSAPAWSPPAPVAPPAAAAPPVWSPPAAVAAPAPTVAPAAPKPAAGPSLDKLLLEVVAEKTGYPVEMLRMDMNLEADLGIDSIKRVEILSAVRERAPNTPEADADAMAKLKTLGQIVGFLGEATGAAAAAPQAAAPRVAAPAAAGPSLDKLLLEVVAEKTGYPVEMLRMDMNLEADLGIDSIKRVEILSAVRERAPNTPEADADAMAKLKTLGQIVGFLGEATGAVAAAAPAAKSGGIALDALLLEVVAEKTGYPAEMLRLDMNLEADLGIDSIKRVEILSAVRERAPDAPEADAEAMAQLKTLGQIVGFLAATNGGVAPSAHPFDGPRAPVARSEVVRVAIPAGSAVPVAPLAVVRDGGGVADLLVAALKAKGIDAVAVSGPEGLDGTRGVVFLATDAPTSPEAALAVDKRAFRVAKKSALGSAWITVTALGGDFGLDGVDPAGAVLGGLAGFTKTVALEHGGAFVRHLDLAPGSAAELATAIAAEIGQAGPVEVSPVGGRWTLEAQDVAIPSAVPALGASDVIVVSGGARGVTAACLVTLAKACRPKLVLLGRSRIDVPEPPGCEAAKDEAGLKKALFAADKTVPPAELGRRASAILAAREARANVAEMERAGSVVRYVAVDVGDAPGVATALAKVRAELGPITGVVHGAGVIQDKRILEKTDAQFDAVVDTKVVGLFALLAATAGDPLKVLALFSSVAGRGGNVGQSDYAMANEVLNKVAASEARRRPGCVVKSYGWGPWEGGMVTPALRRQFEAMGVPLLPIEAGARAFVEELAAPGAIELVLGGQLGLGRKERERTEKRRVSAKDHPYLHDHALGGDPVFPVVLALEWMAQATRTFRPERSLRAIRDVKVLKGIPLRGFSGIGDELEVHAVERDADHVALEIRTPGGAVHYRAVAELGDRLEAAPKAPQPVRGAWAHGEIYDGETLFHGPDFHVIREVTGVGDEGMDAIVVGTRDAGWPTRTWATDPAAFDAGLQLALLWTRHLTGQASLPTSLGGYHPFGAAAPGPIRCAVRARKQSARSTVTDLLFIDAAGHPYAELRGVEVHTLPSGSYPRAAEAK